MGASIAAFWSVVNWDVVVRFSFFPKAWIGVKERL